MKHTPNVDNNMPNVCAACEDEWPCKPRLAEENERLRAALAETLTFVLGVVRAGQGNGPVPPPYEMESKIRAALAGREEEK